MSSLSEIIKVLFNELKVIIKELVHETEDVLKKRLKEFLIRSIIISILLALVTSFLGSAALFTQIGSLEYLMTLMPAWKAWFITGISSGVIGALILLGLYLFIRKQLKPSQLPVTVKPENRAEITLATKDTTTESNAK